MSKYLPGTDPAIMTTAGPSANMPDSLRSLLNQIYTQYKEKWFYWYIFVEGQICVNAICSTYNCYILRIRYTHIYIYT